MDDEEEQTPKQKTGNVITRHALLFTVALGGIVLVVLIILMRQKGKGATASTASATPGDAGLTAGYPPSLAESITNIYGSGGSTTGGGASTGSTGSSAAPVGPPIAPPPASGANSITTNAVYSGSAGRVPPEPAHGRLPLFRTPPVSA